MKREGICPACNGTSRVPADEYAIKYGWYGYDKDTSTQYCSNCGPLGMFSKPDGKVSLRPDGTPCHHQFRTETIGRCYHRSTCVHCDYSYTIDSGD